MSRLAFNPSSPSSVSELCWTFSPQIFNADGLKHPDRKEKIRLNEEDAEKPPEKWSSCVCRQVELHAPQSNLQEGPGVPTWKYKMSRAAAGSS
ncbi:hypothetical protein NQZ68_018581 [Dissostichus eleginoides]|nr:hypothetical protein NQZ68_018581 [Dissostichus eleginoides]